MESTSSKWLSTRARLALGVAFAAGLSISSGGASSDASSNSSDAEDEVEIQKLTVCYARGTDVISGGDLAGGKNIYQGCFTNDAEISVYFPGANFNGAPDFTTTGTSSWADFVDNTFAAYGYTYTQHLVGTIDVHVTGNHASMTSYLNATQVLPDGTIDVVNGNYVDEVVRKHGHWKIKRRTLKIHSFVHLGTPAP
jgi:SnoaL-like domain